MNFKPYLLSLWNFWPPLLFSGIKIIHRSKDFREFKVKLKLRFWNANYVGTQYGGSIYSMTDPFYMVMLMKNLGPNYIVWDKASSIRYLKPGKTDLFADFLLTEADIDAIYLRLLEEPKIDWVRKVEIRDREGVIVAEVERTVFIKKKDKPSATS